MISFIVCSYDGYEECWNPFFTQLKKYFPESVKFEIILSTTTKIYEFHGLEIKTLAHGDNSPWGERLKMSLKHAKYDVVMPLSEDYFLRSKVNFKQFSYFVNLIYNNKKIDHIRLLRYRVLWEAKKSEFDYLEEIKLVTKHRFLLIPGLWRKQTLNKYLKNYENVFMSEKISGFRSWIRKDGFYSINEEFVEKYGQAYDTLNSGFVFKGKWVSWGIEFLEAENLNIDFSKRGILTDDFMKKTRMKSKLEMFKNPISTSRSIISLIILFFQSFFRIKK
ncbi:MAG: hypothetical protein L3J08_03080 [Flavobacteriaceae bacterium]|nr:hypothetical protein [Flavobacteriaceae bacterium]